MIITYRNLTLLNTRSERNPVGIGAIMVHTQNERDSFIHFAQTLESHYEMNKRNTTHLLETLNESLLMTMRI
jgi:hypothetical protein